jgi:16S rRNA pseudouridine516 synthase
MEGKFHQVKRMVEVVGKKVVELSRLSMGGLILDNQLKRGSYRSLTESEIQKLTEKK